MEVVGLPAFAYPPGVAARACFRPRREGIVGPSDPPRMRIMLMPYEPPSGWVERRVYPASDPAVDEKERLRFHVRPDCTLIEGPEHLMAVDRPYTARPVQPLCVGRSPDR